MKKNTAAQRAAKSARPSSTHRIPIGLQIAIRALDGFGGDGKSLRENLRTADAKAASILNDPLVRLEEEGPGAELHQLAAHFGYEEIAERIAKAIPDTVTHDPHSWLADLAVCWQNAGLYLGLCLGFRIAAGLRGQEDVR